MQCAAQFVVVIVTCAYIYYLLHGTLLSGHGVYCGKSKGKIINSKDYNLSELKISQVNCELWTACGCWWLRILLCYKSKHQGCYSIKNDFLESISIFLSPRWTVMFLAARFFWTRIDWRLDDIIIKITVQKRIILEQQVVNRKLKINKLISSTLHENSFLSQLKYK